MSCKTKKAIFLDRNDTLIDDPGDITSPNQIELLSGAVEALAQFKKMGYLLVVLADRPCDAHIQESELRYHLKSLLAAREAALDGMYDWPQHPDGAMTDFSVQTNLQQSDSDVLELAAGELNIDLNLSWMIGDTYRDIKAGKRAGCQTILVDVPGQSRPKRSDDPEPDRKAVNLREAVNIVRMYEFHQKAQNAKKNLKDADPPQAATPVKEIPEPAATPHPVPAQTAGQTAAEKTQTPPTAARSFTPDKPAAAPQPVKKFHTARKATPTAHEPWPDEHSEKTHHLLEEVLQRLKSHGRTEMYDDFSVFKLLAIMVQVVTLACIAFSLAAWMSREPNTDKVQILVGYAVVLQLLVIALLMMHRKD